MRILSTYHPPSTVISSIHCYLTGSEGSEGSHLVIARPNRIDVHAVLPSGLEWRAGMEVWGLVVDVKVGRAMGTKEDMILVLTDHPYPMILVVQYIPPSSQTPARLEVISSKGLDVRLLRHSDFTQSLFLSFPLLTGRPQQRGSEQEPEDEDEDEEDARHFTLSKVPGSVVLVAPYSGKLSAQRLGSDGLDEIHDFNVIELNILDIGFLPPFASSTPSTSSPQPTAASSSSKSRLKKSSSTSKAPVQKPHTIAMLYKDHRQLTTLALRDIDSELKDIEFDVSSTLHFPGSSNRDPGPSRKGFGKITVPDDYDSGIGPSKVLVIPGSTIPPKDKGKEKDEGDEGTSSPSEYSDESDDEEKKRKQAKTAGMKREPGVLLLGGKELLFYPVAPIPEDGGREEGASAPVASMSKRGSVPSTPTKRGGRATSRGSSSPTKSSRGGSKRSVKFANNFDVYGGTGDEEEVACSRVDWPYGPITAYTIIDSHTSQARVLIGDKYGRLIMASIRPCPPSQRKSHSSTAPRSTSASSPSKGKTATPKKSSLRSFGLSAVLGKKRKESPNSKSKPPSKGKAKVKVTWESESESDEEEKMEFDDPDPEAETEDMDMDEDDRRENVGRKVGGKKTGAEWGKVIIELLYLGETSPATTLSYINNGVVFVGSHFGDSMVIQLIPSPSGEDENGRRSPSISEMKVALPQSPTKGKGKGRDQGGNLIRILDRHNNIAPIVDACIVDRDGDKEIVTASGGANSGSLRVIRHGADFQIRAQVEDLAGVARMWAVKKSVTDGEDTYLVASTLTETRVLILGFGANAPTIEQDNALSNPTSSGSPFVTKLPTLACGSVTYLPPNGGALPDSTLVAQVTRESVVLVDVTSATRVSEWVPPKVFEGNVITTAALSSSQICVGVAGGKFVMLMLDEKDQLVVCCEHIFKGQDGPQEISAICCTPSNPHDYGSLVIAIGFWSPPRVHMYKCPESGHLQGAQLEQGGDVLRTPSVPYSILFTSFGAPIIDAVENQVATAPSPVQIVVGMVDGSLYHCMIDQGGKALTGRMLTLGGSRPIEVSHIPVRQGAGMGVFVSGDKAGVVSFENGRLRHSAMNVKNIISSTMISTLDWRDCIAFASPTGLVIGQVREVQKLHIRTIPLGLDNPHRLRHHPELQVVGVGHLRTEPAQVGEMETVTSTFAIYDDVNYNRLSAYGMKEGEEIHAVEVVELTVHIHGESTDVRDSDGMDIDNDLQSGSAFPSGEKRKFFAVGTVGVATPLDTSQPGSIDATSGRIMLFDGSEAFTKPLATKIDQKLPWLVTGLELHGGVFCLRECKGFLVAAINSSVSVFRLEAARPGTGSSSVNLNLLATANYNYLVTSLVIQDDLIFVGDIYNSISVFRLCLGESRKKKPVKQPVKPVRKEKARVPRRKLYAGRRQPPPSDDDEDEDDEEEEISDNENDQVIRLEVVTKIYVPPWPVTLQRLSQNTVIGNDMYSNVFAYKLTESGDKPRLEADGVYRTAEMTNVFIPGSVGSVPTDDPKQPAPLLLYFTSNGRIGVISEFTDREMQLRMTELQRNLAYVIRGPGEIEHAVWRRPVDFRGHTDKEPEAIGFLDGDFLERYLAQTGSELVKTRSGKNDAEALKLSHKEIVEILERLQEVH